MSSAATHNNQLPPLLARARRPHSCSRALHLSPVHHMLLREDENLSHDENSRDCWSAPRLCDSSSSEPRDGLFARRAALERMGEFLPGSPPDEHAHLHTGTLTTPLPRLITARHDSPSPQVPDDGPRLPFRGIPDALPLRKSRVSGGSRALVPLSAEDCALQVHQVAGDDGRQCWRNGPEHACRPVIRRA